MAATQPRFEPLEFFLCSFLKDIVYKNAPWSIAQLKKIIAYAIRIIDTTMCYVLDNIRKLAEKGFLCLENERGNFEPLSRFHFFFFFFC